MTTKLLKVLILALFLLSNIASKAQKRLDFPETYFGFQGGASGSMLNFNPTVSQGFLLGYNGGISFRFIAHKVAGVQAELNYSQRGWAESDELYARQLNYLELPFMTHFYFGRNFRFHFNIGPQLSYLLSENVLVDNTVNSEAEQHTKTVHNKFDYGFCGGPGFSFRFNRQVIILDIRAAYSVSDVFSNAKRDYFDYSNNMN
ncbi:MAG: PorT family protein, partial [Candidatus Moranbacteria bacterium]|nr:PorT family protein [Candidatus Moranbacteria bacterium]